MTDIIDLAITLTIGGVDYSSHVKSVTRRHAICKPGQMVTLGLRPSVDHASILPWQDVVLYEQGTLVFTGYVSLVEVKRPPNEIIVECNDTHKRALCVLTDRGLKTDNETVAYWVDYMCNLAGISYSIEADNSDLVVIDNIPLELKMVSECLFTLASYAGWVMRVEPDGVLKFLNIASEPIGDVDALEWLRETGDADSRNDCIIWGFDINTRTTRSFPEIGLGRTMVFANPIITTAAMAEYIAQFALDQFCVLDDHLTVEVIGNPDINVGNILTFDAGGTYANTITELRSEMDSGGYRLTLSCGRKCLRLPALPINSGSSAVYVGTNYALGRSNNFYTTTGSDVHWEDVDSSGSLYGLTSFTLDKFTPAQTGYATAGSSGIYVTKRLYRTDPPWNRVLNPAQFLASTGCALKSVDRIKSTQAKQGTVFARATDVANNVYVGRSTDWGTTWVWSDPIVNTSGSMLGFEVSPWNANYVWTGGSYGSIFRSSNALTGLDFSNIYNVVDGVSVNDIHVPRDGNSSGSTIWIGGYKLKQSKYQVSFGTFTRSADRPECYINNETVTSLGGVIFSWHFNVHTDGIAFSGGVTFNLPVTVLNTVSTDVVTFRTTWISPDTLGDQWYVQDQSGFLGFDYSGVHVTKGTTPEGYLYVDWTGTVAQLGGQLGSTGPSGGPAWRYWPVYHSGSDNFYYAINVQLYSVNGERVYPDESSSFIMKSTNGGTTFVDHTPPEGGAITMYSIGTNAQSSARVYGISSGSAIVRTLTSGSPWTVMDYPYSGACNIKLYSKDWRRVFYLDDNGVYYTPDGFTTYSDRTADWQDVFGFGFSECGNKVAMEPVMV